MARVNPTKDKKKKLIIVGQDHSSLKVIKWAGGGELPKILQGMWTHETPAQNAIDAYLANTAEIRPVQVTNVAKIDSGAK